MKRIDDDFLNDSVAELESRGLKIERHPDRQLKRLTLERGGLTLEIDPERLEARLIELKKFPYDHDETVDDTELARERFINFVSHMLTEVEDRTMARNRCAFCLKAGKQVKNLIAGPTVYICNECVDVCNNVLRVEALL